MYCSQSPAARGWRSSCEDPALLVFFAWLAELSSGDGGEGNHFFFQDACAYQMRLPRGSFYAVSAFQRGFIYAIS